MAPDPSGGGQLKALERLAEYPQRVARLRALWIDVQGGGQFYLESQRSRNQDTPRSRSPSADGPLTAVQIRELMSRDLTPEDYELLLLLDEGVKKAKTLSSDSAAFLPRATGTEWVNEACSICLCALEEDEDVRLLPSCGHIFHAPCAQRWLTSERAACPLCGQEEATQDKVVGVFRKFDADGDGLISLAEMQSVLKALDPEFWNPERVERLFMSADAKRDGTLDAEEFINWLFAGGAVPGAPDLERCVTRDRLREAVVA